MEIVRKTIPVVKNLTIKNFKKGDIFLYGDEVMLRTEDIHTQMSSGNSQLFSNAVSLINGRPYIFSDHILRPISGKFVEE